MECIFLYSSHYSRNVGPLFPTGLSALQVQWLCHPSFLRETEAHPSFLKGYLKIFKDRELSGQFLSLSPPTKTHNSWQRRDSHGCVTITCLWCKSDIHSQNPSEHSFPSNSPDKQWPVVQQHQYLLELVTNAESWALSPDLLSQNLHFNKSPTLKCEKHCFKEDLYTTFASLESKMGIAVKGPIPLIFLYFLNFHLHFARLKSHTFLHGSWVQRPTPNSNTAVNREQESSAFAFKQANLQGTFSNCHVLKILRLHILKQWSNPLTFFF